MTAILWSTILAGSRCGTRIRAVTKWADAWRVNLPGSTPRPSKAWAGFLSLTRRRAGDFQREPVNSSLLYACPRDDWIIVHLFRAIINTTLDQEREGGALRPPLFLLSLLPPCERLHGLSSS